MYDRILVPTDGTPGSERAARTALDLAATHGATVYAVSVVSDDQFGRRGSRTGRVERAKTALNRVQSEFEHDDVDLRIELLEGPVVDQLLQYVARHRIDLVVMGTHGRKGLNRVVLGSVTERVLREADVPVLAVHLGTDEDQVTSIEQARAIAQETLEERGYEEIEVEDGAYDERSAFVVQAVADGQRVNLHVEKATGDPHLVPLGAA